MIHRQALVVKYLEPTQEAVMHDVIKIVNFTKGHAQTRGYFANYVRIVKLDMRIYSIIQKQAWLPGIQ